MKVHLLILLVAFLIGCSEAEHASSSQTLSSVDAQNRLKRCWNVEPMRQNSNSYRIKYMMYVSVGSGPWVGVSDKCERMYISFNDSENLFEGVVSRLKEERSSEPFDSFVLQVDVVGEVKKQPYNSLNLEFDLKKILKAKVLNINSEEFYESYVKQYR